MEIVSKVADQLSDVLSSKEVIAALLGAFAGGLMTYWAAAYQEQRRDGLRQPAWAAAGARNRFD